MPEAVLIDTGPIVAMLSARDEHHVRCVEISRNLRAGLLTTWPVLTEAVWLLRHDRRAMQALFQAFHEGAFKLAAIEDSAIGRIEQIILDYSNLPADLADATLLYLAEARGIARIFTLDSRDFEVYRTRDGRALNIIS